MIDKIICITAMVVIGILLIMAIVALNYVSW